MEKYGQIRQSAYDANMQLPRMGLVLFSFGNVSVADRDLGVFAIKPSGVPYSDLSPGDMVIVDFNGKTVDGNLRPSSDTLTHAVLYNQWDSICSIVHTHSGYATSWAQAQRDIPIYGTTHADYITCDIPCTPPMEDDMIAGNYERETGNQIINYFKWRELDYKEVEMILVGNHGPFTWGKTPERAVTNSAVLEELARMAYFTEQIKPGVLRMKGTLIRKHYERKHGPGSYYGQE
jgi:L-ribulose-5-phosphate 4-epimerase